MIPRDLTYGDFYRTGVQDCGNAIDLDEFDLESGGTASQIVDLTWSEWEEDDLEGQWRRQQDFEGLDPHRAYESWRSGWKDCATQLIKDRLKGRQNPARRTSAIVRTEDVERTFRQSPAIRGGVGSDARMAIKSGEMSNPEQGRYRVTFFGLDGPYGHATRDTERKISEEARDWLRAPIVPMSDADVIAWTSTEEFIKGSKVTAFVQAENTLRWRAGKVGMSDWASGVIAQANDIGTRNGTVNNRGKPYDAGALDDATVFLATALEKVPGQHDNPPRFWIRKPTPRRDQPCYPTKTAALKKFLDVNADIVQGYGGADYEVSPSEFDVINHKYGLTGKRAARTIADAVWIAMPVGRPYCLERIDLDALNDTSPAKEADVPFRLPDVEHEMARKQAAHYRDLPEPAWVTEIDEIEPPIPKPSPIPAIQEVVPYHLELEEQEPGVATYRISIPQVMRPRLELVRSPPSAAPAPVTVSKPPQRAITAPRPKAAPLRPMTVPRPYRLELENEEPGVAHYRIANPAGHNDDETIEVTKLDRYKHLANLAKRWSQGPFHAPPELRKYVARVPKEAPFGSEEHGLVDRGFWLGEVLDDIRRNAESELDRENMAKFDRFLDLMTARSPFSENPGCECEAPKENPAWVTNILSKHFLELEENVPPQWLPKLTRPRAVRGKITAAMEEYGCGAYGCVLPTLDDGVVLKLTTDVTEAEFARDVAGRLSAPVVVKYRLTRELPDKYKGRQAFLLWRDSAERVGEIADVVEERGGNGDSAWNAIVDQHRAAQEVFSALHDGRPVEQLIERWERAARKMGKVPELRELAEGMIRNLEKDGVFMGDVHSGNLGRVDGRWVVVDPGHVAVLEDG